MTVGVRYLWLRLGQNVIFLKKTKSIMFLLCSSSSLGLSFALALISPSPQAPQSKGTFSQTQQTPAYTLLLLLLSLKVWHHNTLYMPLWSQQQKRPSQWQMTALDTGPSTPPSPKHTHTHTAGGSHGPRGCSSPAFKENRRNSCLWKTCNTHGYKNTLHRASLEEQELM